MFHGTALVRIIVAASLFATLAGGGSIAHGGPVEPFGLRTGDATGDGVVDAFDALHVLFYGAGLSNAESDGWRAVADVNADGMVNSVDASLILEYVAGLLSHLPP